MQPVLVIENDPHDPLGRLGYAIDARGLSTHIVRPPAGEVIPDPDGYCAVVVLGGPQAAYRTDLHPFLEDEMDLIRRSVDIGVPLLGICLGAQLVAEALGGKAYLAETPEVAVLEPTLTEAGTDDPISTHITKPVLVFHQDSFEPPPGATVVACTEQFPQAFRVGSALALQPHPEARAHDVEQWVAASDLAERAGIDGRELISAMTTRIEAGDARALFDAWLDEFAPSAN